MKNVFKRILVLAVLFGTLTAYSNENVINEISYNNVEVGDKIKITDANGVMLYNGTVNYSGSLMNRFDFSQLKDGNYTVEIVRAYVIEVKSINVKNHVVTYNYNAENKIFKPVFRLIDSKLIISKLALDSNKMEIELYFGDDLIYSENLVGDSIINRIYKLDETEVGDYTAVIKTNGRTFIKNFKI